MLKSFRTKLEGVLVSRGLTQTDLYDLIVSSGYKKIGKDRINRMITGTQANYTLDTILILCEVLNLTPNDIIDYEQ